MRPSSDIGKDCLLRNLKNGIEVVISTEGCEVGIESSLVRCVAEVLAHGLRPTTADFWQVVRQVTHSRLADSLAWGPLAPRTPASDHVQGLLWIYYTLLEGSLSSYVRCLISDKRLLQKHYQERALLRDCIAASKFVTLLTSLANLDITPVENDSL
uniref:RUN domain-containing protein n=1 Tax=Rhodnius prolixus TaxID=13249 RepID=T1HHI1_RHOPR